MEMANYIYSILRNQLNIIWSWGFNSPKALINGLQFKVEGFIFKGIVRITYNQGKDLFEISLLNNKMGITKKIEDVYFDQLVDIIDSEVEKCENYEDRVKQEYSYMF